MAYKDLKEFINILDKKEELVRIRTLVSSDLEITEITDRISKKGGPALLFENVAHSPYPVLINAFGSYKRMSLSLRAETLDSIGEDIGKYLDLSNYTSLKKLIRFIPNLFRLLCCFPIRSRWNVKRPLCQQVIERNPDLDILPVLKCWPLDGGKFFTLPLVFTKYYGCKNQNIGMYRMQILDKASTAMHWHKHKDGAGIYEDYRKHGEKMPVSVALGCDPAVTYAATAPLPPKMDEIMLAGFLRKRPIKMVKSVTNDIYIPANAQFVLEGYIDPEEELVWEGPFGDHTGYYSLADWYPRFHVTCVTHQKKPVYPATIVGKPPMEDCYMAKATERIFLPVLQFQIPQLVNLNLPLEGVFHNCAIASVKDGYPGAAMTVMNGIWGMGQMRCTKMIVVIDGGIDPYDREKVWEALLTNVDFGRDLVFSKGPLDALDHSSDHALYGTRLGIDATHKGKGASPESCGLKIVKVKKDKAFAGQDAAKKALERYKEKIIFAVDDTEDENDLTTIMWRVFNNIDAGRDLIIKNGRVAVDATKKVLDEGLKRPWPEDIAMSGEIVEMVSKRWDEYGIQGYQTE